MSSISYSIFHPIIVAGTCQHPVWRVCTLSCFPIPMFATSALSQISLFPASDDGSFIFLRFILPRSSPPSSHHSLSALFSRSHDSAVRPLLPESQADGGAGGGLQRHFVRYGTSIGDLQSTAWCVEHSTDARSGSRTGHATPSLARHNCSQALQVLCLVHVPSRR